MMELDRPTVAEVRPLVNALLARKPLGCCLHIVLDDLNVDQRSIDACCCYALEADHQECFDLAMTMRRMTASQRHRLARGA